MDHIPSIIKRIKYTKIIIWLFIIFEIIDLFLLITKGNDNKFGNGSLLSVRIFIILYTYLGGFLFLYLTNKLNKKIPDIESYDIFIIHYNIYISSAYLIYTGILLMMVEVLDNRFRDMHLPSIIVFSIGIIWNILLRFTIKQKNKVQ